MKIRMYSLIFLLLFMACKKKTDINPVDPPPIKKGSKTPNPFLNIRYSPLLLIGTRAHPCVSGPCCCVGDKGLCPGHSISIIPREPKISLCQGEGIGRIVIVNKRQKVKLILYDDFSLSTDPNYEIRYDRNLDPHICKTMGLTKIVLKKGMYNMNYSQHPHGHVFIDAIVK